MRRREFIAGLGSAAATWPVAARAQQSQRMRRIGVLMFFSQDDPIGQSVIATFQQALRELGWIEGRNVTIDYRWGALDTNRFRRYAAELVALAPDVIVAGNGGTAAALQQASGTVPIVFMGSPDPVGSGLIESLARPGGNITGFAGVEYGQSGKLLGLLKEIAPRVTRAAVIRDPANTAGTGFLGAIQTAAASIGVDVRPIGGDAASIERGVAAFASSPNAGLVVPNTRFAYTNRELIIKLAARHQLPAVYGGRLFVSDGGLVSYGAAAGPDRMRRVAGYVDRILKGERPADLPVQAPTKFELVINAKTAKALGLTIPETLLATADEVIQ
jgi:putative tryptophan/tyrosine transport system substrate-binding protein